MFIVLCEAVAEYRAALDEIHRDGLTTVSATGNRREHPAVKIKNAAISRFRAASVAFGLSPVDRVGLPSIDPDSGDSARMFEELA